mgnify:CR=1 FL=1
MSMFPNAERVLSAVAGLALFTLNEVRMFQTLPRAPDPAHAYAAAIQILDAATPVYLGLADLAVRWGLVGVTIAPCLWALAETFGIQPQPVDRP